MAELSFVPIERQQKVNRLSKCYGWLHVSLVLSSNQNIALLSLMFLYEFDDECYYKTIILFIDQYHDLVTLKVLAFGSVNIVLLR